MKKLFTLLALVIATGAHAQLSSGLVAWWTFNGSVKDGSGKGHNGTATNITYTTGKSGTTNTAALFNGTSSHVDIPYQSDLNLTKYSICGVMKFNGFYTALCQVNTILTRGNFYTNGYYTLEVSDSPIDSSCVVTGDTNNFIYTSGLNGRGPYHKPQNITNKLHTGNWYCVVITYDSLVYKLYMNGILVNTYYPQNSTGTIGTSTDGIGIGANRFGDTSLYPYWFKGVMDDLRLYNRALSATEIDGYCVNYNNIIPESVAFTPELSFLQVFPNPNQGSFTIKGIANGNTQIGIDVVNTLGQTIYHDVTTALNGNIEKLISLPDVPKGVYYLRLNTGEAIKTHKLLIE